VNINEVCGLERVVCEGAGRMTLLEQGPVFAGHMGSVEKVEDSGLGIGLTVCGRANLESTSSSCGR
jgi:hypothetical protein